MCRRSNPTIVHQDPWRMLSVAPPRAPRICDRFRFSSIKPALSSRVSTKPHNAGFWWIAREKCARGEVRVATGKVVGIGVRTPGQKSSSGSRGSKGRWERSTGEELTIVGEWGRRVAGIRASESVEELTRGRDASAGAEREGGGGCQDAGVGEYEGARGGSGCARWGVGGGGGSGAVMRAPGRSLGLSSLSNSPNP